MEEEYTAFMKKFNEAVLLKNVEIIEQDTHTTGDEIDQTAV